MNSMQCQQVLFAKVQFFFGRSKESRSQIVQRRVAVEPLKTNISPFKNWWVGRWFMSFYINWSLFKGIFCEFLGSLKHAIEWLRPLVIWMQPRRGQAVRFDPPFIVSNCFYLPVKLTWSLCSCDIFAQARHKKTCFVPGDSIKVACFIP